MLQLGWCTLLLLVAIVLQNSRSEPWFIITWKWAYEVSCCENRAVWLGFVILLSIFAFTAVPVRAHSRSLPHLFVFTPAHSRSLPLTLTRADAIISLGEWQKPHDLLTMTSYKQVLPSLLLICLKLHSRMSMWATSYSKRSPYSINSIQCFSNIIHL